MSRTLPVALAIAIVVAAGLVHGRLTRRWGRSEAVEVAAARLGRVPMDLEGWKGRPLGIGREQLEMAGIVGHLVRCYQPERGGPGVTILLVCGPPGPISVHTPDVCYSGAGYDPMGPTALVSPASRPDVPPARFRAGVFGRRDTPLPTYLRILWAWSAGGGWEAPDNPRMAFAGRGALYKLYVIRELGSPGDLSVDDPSLELLRALLPELERDLFEDRG